MLKTEIAGIFVVSYTLTVQHELLNIVEFLTEYYVILCHSVVTSTVH